MSDKYRTIQKKKHDMAICSIHLHPQQNVSDDQERGPKGREHRRHGRGDHTEAEVVVGWETWAPEYWLKWFREEREAALVLFTSEQSPLEKNMDEWIQFWSMPDRTV
jgi:mannose-6-phosphate isomerase class I